MSSFLPVTTDPIDVAAADWLARRDRGLSCTEQDAYLAWLQADPRHGAALARHQETLRRLMSLGEWQPGLSQEPNPDLFAPRSRRAGQVWRRWAPVLGLAAAVAVAALVGVSWPWGGERVTAPSPFLRVNERLALPDGSLVELKDGSRIETRFTAEERRVRLTGGEALFTVAREEERPFIVEAAAFEVQALGTVFNVRIDAAEVDVLVTQGRVRVAPAAPPEQPGTSLAGAVLAAGERTRVRLVPDDLHTVSPVAPLVTMVTPEEIREALHWQTPMLQFHETPLRVAVAEFNRHNPHRIVIDDARLAETPIGGSFRVDNVAGFLRAAEITLDAVAESRETTATHLRAAR